MNTTISTRRPRVSALIVALAAICAIGLSGCAGVVADLKGISDAGAAFTGAIANGDAAGAAAMMHPRGQASGDMVAAIKSAFIAQKFSDPAITNTSISNGVGELSGTCKLNDKGGTLTMQLEKDGDTWKVLNINCKVN